MHFNALAVHNGNCLSASGKLPAPDLCGTVLCLAAQGLGVVQSCFLVFRYIWVKTAFF